MAQLITESSITVDSGGRSQKVEMSTTHAESTAINSESALVYVTADCFVRQGSPGGTVSVSDGTDEALVGGNQYRVVGITPGNVLSFVTAAGTGTAYITPGV